MTPDEHRALLARLRGTWPGEWDEERCAVWVETMDPYPFAVAVAAIRAMAEECEFASVAAFTRHARRRPGAVVVDDERGMFLPGSGWLRPAGRRALPPVEPDDGPGDAQIIGLEEARRRLEEARRQVIKRPPNGGQEVSP